MTTRMMAALVAAVVAAAGCGGNPEADPSPSATARVIDPTVSPTAAGSSPTGSAAPTSGPTGGEPTSDPSSEAPDPTPPPTSDPNPNPEGVDPEPIPAGTYRYDTAGWSQIGNGPKEPMPNTTKLVAAAPSGNQQDVTRDLRDSDGYGQAIRRRMEYSSKGFLLHVLHTTGKVDGGLLGDFPIDTKLTAAPPGQLGAPDSDVGWTTSFTMSGDGTTAGVTAELIGFEDVTIGGKTVRAAIVRQRVELSGEINGSSTATTWFRPEDLLPLQEASDTTASSQGFATKSHYTAKLLSLTPS